jgi:hypothetical protein
MLPSAPRVCRSPENDGCLRKQWPVREGVRPSDRVQDLADHTPPSRSPSRLVLDLVASLHKVKGLGLSQARQSWPKELFCKSPPPADLGRLIRGGMPGADTASTVKDAPPSTIYRSVRRGRLRASSNGGEISLSRSASRLKSAIGRRESVRSTAFARHSGMFNT